MSIGRPLLALLSLFFLAGACLLIFLTLLGGVTNTNPLNQIYFLEADTGNIPGAPTVSRWTFYSLCAVTGKGHNDCGKHHPALPLDPPNGKNFGTTENVPPEFIGSSKYFYMTRFLFAFTLISIVFAVLALLTGLAALFSRIGSYISSFLCFIALIFQTIAAALMTAAYVMGRRNFDRNGQSARLGVKAFAFMWTSVALLFLSTLLYCVGGVISPRGKRRSGDKKSRGMFGGKGEHRRSKGDYSDHANGHKDGYA